MQILAFFWHRLGQILATLVLSTLLYLPLSHLLGVQPAYAASTRNNQDTQETIERAYEEFGGDAGAREEIYRQRIQEGQDPEKMPRAFRHVESYADRKEVPETSLLETTVSKTRQLLQPDAEKK